ncbi:MAG TPA: PadR family transcriptional regulator [Woeseiaceae bacterium]|nr:PadR family transcriptional regulator [Woeseiaceae bacterium]
MSLPHILLGMLREPHSGYDLKQAFSSSLQHFWHAELSQIYPTLKRLENDGLVTSRIGETRAGPQRREYRRTERGRRQLLEWLRSGPVTGTERTGYLAQVFFFAELDDDDQVLKYLGELRDHMAEWLAVLESADAMWRDAHPQYPDGLPDEDFYPQMTLALGVRKVRANLEWCEESIARVRKRRRKAARAG